MRELGELLRNTREAEGLSVADVQEATKIRARYLEAMEEGRFEALPGEVYVKGFLRSFAEAVGLSGDEVVARYKAERARIETEKAREAHPDQGRDVSKKSRIRRHWLMVVALVAIVVVAIVVVVVGVVVWRQGHVPAGSAGVCSGDQGAADLATGEGAEGSPGEFPSEAQPGEATTLPGAPEAGPRATAPGALIAPVTPARPPIPAAEEAFPAGEGHELSVAITERCWVRVVADGKVVFERSMLAGEEATWRAERSIRIKVGNASGIDVTYNGVHIGVLGKPGQVVERAFPED